MQHTLFTMLGILKLCKITYIYIASCFLSACFVMPYCCVGLVRLSFDVHVLVYLFCLLGIDEFHIFWTVHLDMRA